MNFSKALKHLKAGKCISREEWYMGVYIFLCKGLHHFDKDTNGIPLKMAGIEGIRTKLFNEVASGEHTVLPHIAKKTNSGCFEPFVASASDLLASDWMLVEDEPEMTAADIEC